MASKSMAAGLIRLGALQSLVSKLVDAQKRWQYYC